MLGEAGLYLTRSPELATSLAGCWRTIENGSKAKPLTSDAARLQPPGPVFRG